MCSLIALLAIKYNYDKIQSATHTNTTSSLYDYNEQVMDVEICNIERKYLYNKNNTNSNDFDFPLNNHDLLRGSSLPFVLVYDTEHRRKSHSIFSKEKILNKFYHLEVVLSSTNSFSHGRKDTTLGNYINKIMKTQTLNSFAQVPEIQIRTRPH